MSKKADQQIEETDDVVEEKVKKEKKKNTKTKN